MAGTGHFLPMNISLYFLFSFPPLTRIAPPPPGVLLLNAVLTVRAHQANSHRDQGWETFTDAVVQCLNTQLSGLVFMLWGAYAQRKGDVIDRVGAGGSATVPAAYTTAVYSDVGTFHTLLFLRS